MEGENFVCNLCCFSTNNFKDSNHHYIRKHKSEPNYFVSCAIGACSFTTRRWNTFKVHVHRKHHLDPVPNPPIPAMGQDQHEGMDTNDSFECVPFNEHNNLSYYNALYTMSLEAKHNISQTAVDHIVSSTSILLNAQLDHFKAKLKQELQSRNINSDFIDGIDIHHMLDDFESS